MEKKALVREFKFKAKKLDDIDPSMPPEKVVAHYAATYPEMLNSSLTGPVIENDKAIYTVSHVAGTKG